MPLPPAAIARRMAEFEELCRARGVPLTVQRRVILQAVLERSDHPSAEQVYDVVRERVPEVSRTTVYRVLETLVEFGLIARAHHQGSTIRFDAKTHRHHHLVCVACRRVVDYEAPDLNHLPLPEPASTGFEARDYSIQFTGLCAACRGEAASEAAGGVPTGSARPAQERQPGED